MAGGKDFGGLSAGERVLTYSGFAILGLANTILPFIVFSANYLIIPYPRYLVLLIETLPALTTKLLLPHVLHHVPYWMRPLSAGCCWILAALVTKAAPPNVAPLVRVLMTMLASGAAAAMEVSMLGLMRYYGRVSLAGWALGTGAGGVGCAVLPFVFTVWMGSVLRGAVDVVYCLAAAMLLAFFVVLPRAPMNYPVATRGDEKEDLERSPESASDPFFEISQQLSRKNRSDMAKSLIRPVVLPLAVAFAMQAVVFPGIARALPSSAAFTSFFAFSTTYGFIFQLGSFVSRTLFPLLRVRSTRMLFGVLSAAAVLLVLNATFGLVAAEGVVGALVLCAGLAGGAIYVTSVSRVLDGKSGDGGVSQEFRLQVVGAGESAGMLVGGLLGTGLEAWICGMDLGGGMRWCHMRR